MGDGSSVVEKCLFLELWEEGFQEEEGILCSRAGEKFAQWEMFTRFVSRKRFWGSLKNPFQLGSGGRRRRQVPSYRSLKNIFKLSHLSGGFLKDNYLHSFNLSIFPSRPYVSSLVMKEPGLIGEPGIKHRLATHCSHILWKCQRKQESKGSSRVHFMSDNYQLCGCGQATPTSAHQSTQMPWSFFWCSWPPLAFFSLHPHSYTPLWSPSYTRWMHKCFLFIFMDREEVS